MSAYSDFLDKHDDLITKVNDAIMYSKFHAIKEVYIDLALLKDTRLGLILATDKEALPYIKANLDRYQMRPNRSFTFAFPKLKYKESEYQKMYKDAKYSRDIFNCSPDTSLSGMIKRIFIMLYDNNTRVRYFDKIHVTVNTYPLQQNDLTKTYCNILNNISDGRAVVEFITTDPRTIDTDKWRSMDLMFIDNINYTCDVKGTLYKPLIEEASMPLTQIYAPYSCEDSMLHQWQRYNVDFTDKETVKLLFQTTELVMNTLCHFLFASFDVATDK